MPSYRQIKRRIRSVQNTAKITNALQLVAASKMRRAQLRAGAAKPYAERLRTVLANLAEQVDAGGEGEATHPLLEQRQGNRVTLVVVSPNRGLSGGLPGNINRRVLQTIREAGTEAQVRAIAVGKKGRDFLVRGGFHVVAAYLDLGDYPSAADVSPIVREVIDDFLGGETDRVLLIYPDFINTATQRPTVRQVLPVEPPDGGEAGEGRPIDYIYEPSAREVLAQLLPRYIEMQIYEAVLQNVASFYSAQMVAMKNATDAANDMVDSLTLAANKARQEQITKELLDIVGGVAALEG
ncbi:MAG TPA: ATP synthase F1 subunit gamma [Dehalococcoidia bacterium]|nr:ATP synthase F1 subunit gamma [Dehalococcoidia bacterium]